MPSILWKVDLHIYFTERRNRVVASEKKDIYFILWALK